MSPGMRDSDSMSPEVAVGMEERAENERGLATDERWEVGLWRKVQVSGLGGC